MDTFPAHPYRPGTPRLLVYSNDHFLITEDGDTDTLPDDYEEMKEFLVKMRATVYVPSVVAWPWLDDAVRGAVDEVWCDEHGNVRGVTAWFGRRNVRVVSAGVWPFDCTGLAYLLLVRETLNHCGEAEGATPAALGWRLQHRLWPGMTTEPWSKVERHPRPNYFAYNTLHDTVVGGRVDWPERSVRYPSVWESDVASAYPAHAFPLPGGQVWGGCGGTNGWKRGVTSYGLVTIRLPSLGVPGPFPLRRMDGVVEYPQAEGAYTTHLWREEIEEALKLGAELASWSGFIWKQWTNGLYPWAHEMHRLRHTAPNTDVAKGIKSAAVAGIGRHGSRRERYVLIPDAQARKGDVPISIGGTFAAYAAREVVGDTLSHQHWYSYIQMAQRLDLWRHMHALREHNVIASNYDAVYTERKPWMGLDRYAAAPPPLGMWRYREIRDAEFLGARQITGYDVHTGARVAVLPGVTRKKG